MDKTPLIIIAVILVATLLFVWYDTAARNSLLNEGGIFLFYGDGCPHCKVVDDFISQNNIEGKVKFSRLEVWKNRGNADLLGQAAVKCKLDVSNGMGVPFLYDGDGEKCYVGQDDVINFFKNEAGIQ